jgi:hypothetical protein
MGANFLKHPGAEVDGTLHSPIEWGGAVINTGEAPHVVSELVASKPELWERLLTGPMPSKAIADTIVLGSD